MKIRLNNNEHQLEQEVSLAAFLELQSLHNLKGTAVAINGKVIPRQNWSIQQLKDNDSILMITASQGG
jgi:sulfur carrier protein